MKQSLSYKSPEQRIVEIIRCAVRELYSFEWDGIITPQTKKDAIHQKLRIDFTLPCFELARSVSKSPVDIAKSLESFINNRSDKQLDKSFTRHFYVHAISGYVNFTIDEQVLLEYVYESKDWFARPRLNLEDNGQTQIIAFDDQLLGHSSTDSADLAVRYLASLHRLFNRKYRIKILKNDLLEGESQDLSYVAKVTRYLNKIDLSERNHYFKDRATQAMYYSDENHDFSLRSAGGRIFGSSLIMFELSRIVQQSQRNQNNRFIILVPQSHHDFIEEFLKSFYGSNSEDLNIVCFDPQVSRANILEITKSKYTIHNHFKRSSRLLESVTRSNIAKLDRVYLLVLSHLPSVLSASFQNHQLPILFDSVNQLVTLSSSLLFRKNGVKVTTDQHRLHKQPSSVK